MTSGFAGLPCRGPEAAARSGERARRWIYPPELNLLNYLKPPRASPQSLNPCGTAEEATHSCHPWQAARPTHLHAPKQSASLRRNRTMSGQQEVEKFLQEIGLESCVQAVVHNGFYTSMEALRGATYEEL